MNDGRKARLIEKTSKIYKRVCRDVGWSHESLEIQKNTPARDRAKGMSDEKIAELREQVDALYCKYLVELETYVLEDLITAHAAGQIRRKERTLDIVQKELLERVLNEDKERNSD